MRHSDVLLLQHWFDLIEDRATAVPVCERIPMKNTKIKTPFLLRDCVVMHHSDVLYLHPQSHTSEDRSSPASVCALIQMEELKISLTWLCCNASLRCFAPASPILFEWRRMTLSVCACNHSNEDSKIREQISVTWLVCNALLRCFIPSSPIWFDWSISSLSVWV